MPNNTPILTPTYQSPIIRIIIDIYDKSTMSTATQTWEALRKFYDWALPFDCEQDCKCLFDEINMELKKIQKNTEGDPLFFETERAEKKEVYLMDKVPEFMRLIKKALFDHGYTKQDFSIKPRYEETPALKVQ